MTTAVLPHHQHHHQQQQLPMNSTIMTNVTLSPDMIFDDVDRMTVIAYLVLFFVSACLNLTVLVPLLLNNRSSKSHVNRFIIHLCVADLIVTFIMMPLEIFWSITVDWRAGDAACRILMFFRAFGFHSSSFLLVTISLDRYFAILHPFSRVNVAKRRARIMISIAWLLAVIASAPQSVIFHTETHPIFRWFQQCVTFEFFPTTGHEQAYNIFNLLTIFIIPLIIIMVSYGLILRTITIKSLQDQLKDPYDNNGRLQGTLCSGLHRIQRARMRTLTMTLIIVVAFVTCWTPYYVMSVWTWFHLQSASKIHPLIQKALFIFAVSSSCTNPIVYGMFTINFRRELDRCCLSRGGANKGSFISRTNRPRSSGGQCSSQRITEIALKKVPKQGKGVKIIYKAPETIFSTVVSASV